MKRITNYKEYYQIEYRSYRGIEVLLLTDHDLKRLQGRAEKNLVFHYEPSIWVRIWHSIQYILNR
jgi:hypothetical protein